MSFKSWLKEEKGGGGFGAFLIIIIIAAAIYAVQFGPSNLLYNPEPDYTAAEYLAPEEDELNSRGYPDNSYPAPNPVNTPREPLDAEPEDSFEETRSDSTRPAAEPKPAPANENKSKASSTTKEKAKPKAKPKRNRLSKEEIVKRKLEQGKTVKQIAEETGLERKYIREVKRRTQQVVW